MNSIEYVGVRWESVFPLLPETRVFAGEPTWALAGGGGHEAPPWTQAGRRQRGVRSRREAETPVTGQSRAQT